MIRILKNNQLPIYLLFLIISMSFFSVALQNILLVLLVITIIYLKGKSLLNFKKFTRNYFNALLIIIIPMLLSIISSMYSVNLEEALDTLMTRSILIAIPLLFLIVDYNEKHYIKASQLFIISTVISTVIMLAKGFFLYIDKQVFFHPNYSHFFNLIHHPYYGAYAIMALVIFLNNFKKYNFNKPIKVLVIILIVIGILLSTARLAQIFLLLVIFNFLFKKLKISFSKTIVTSIISLIIIGFVAFSYSGIRSKYSQSLNSSSSPRIIIWKKSLELLSNDVFPFYGIGIGDYQKELNKLYRTGVLEKEIIGVDLKGYNPHNQYLEFFITNGYIGVFYLLCLILLFYKAIKSRNSSFVLFVLLLAGFSFTECIFNRQLGVYFYACFCSLFLLTYIQTPSKLHNEKTHISTS